MNSIMELILHSTILEKSIKKLALVNAALIISIYIIHLFINWKSILKNTTYIDKWHAFFKIIWIIIFILIISKINLLFAISMALVCFSCLSKAITDIIANKLNKDTNLIYVISSAVFCVFFSSSMTSAYIESVKMCSETIREILGLLFINVKIILFVFSLLVNIIIFIEGIAELLKKIDDDISKYLSEIKLEECDVEKYKYSKYEFRFSDKYNIKFFVILDLILDFIFVPVYAVLNILKLFLYKICLAVKSIIIYVDKLYNNKNQLLITLTKITTIISIVLTNLIVIWNDNVFSPKLNASYNMISSSILIPLIYDQIKDFGKKLKRDGAKLAQKE